MVCLLYKLYFLFPNPTPKPTPHRKLSAFLDFQKQKKLILYDLQAWYTMGTKTMSPQGQGF